VAQLKQLSNEKNEGKHHDPHGQGAGKFLEDVALQKTHE
jgi:hypothetical protein